jgi:hypothetical protein
MSKFVEIDSTSVCPHRSCDNECSKMGGETYCEYETEGEFPLFCPLEES